jgi:histidinol dehydrogenase
MQVFINLEKNKWADILKRPEFDARQLEQVVSSILNEVKQNGDAAVKKFALQYDKTNLQNLKITKEEIIVGAGQVDENLKRAINQAKENITTFHQSQIETINKIETTEGVFCWRKSVAIDKVGLYIPGGTAPLFSTLLMLAIPALLAGCRQIIVCTPTDHNGKINPAILYIAELLGLENIYKIGGVQAIAAMAYGTESVPKVNKIFGPGNQYVTCAKELINKDGIAIDMPAGPSEVAVYADDTCNPVFVAADLLSQAEHGIDSQVILVASNSKIAEEVNLEINKQVNVLPRKDIATKALEYSWVFIIENSDTAFELINEYAPEHLIIASDNAVTLADKVINAGSVFLGHYSPESVGDYASGTNHTLPTNGYAKAYSGVSLDSFVKKITFQQVTQIGLQNIGTAVEVMAAAEGLDAHRNAVTIRLNQIK